MATILCNFTKYTLKTEDTNTNILIPYHNNSISINTLLIIENTVIPISIPNLIKKKKYQTESREYKQSIPEIIFLYC